MPPDTAEEDRAWCEPLRLPQPVKTFEQKLKFHGGPLTLPRHYIYCTRHSPDDRFRRFYDRAQREGWGVPKSTPATIRTSPVPKCWRRCSTASRASGLAAGDARRLRQVKAEQAKRG